MIYLIHFEKKYKRAQHYIGYAEDIQKRIDRHNAGNGARLLKAVKKSGICFGVVRTWDESREFERRLKSRKKAWEFCPICNEKSWMKNALGDKNENVK